MSSSSGGPSPLMATRTRRPSMRTTEVSAAVIAECSLSPELDVVRHPGGKPRAQLRAADLAAHRLRQLGDEVDLAGILVGGGEPLREVLNLLGQCLGGLVARRGDDERADDLRPLGIGL